MKILKGKQTEFNKAKKLNSDPYGTACYTYLERWANLMEEKMSAGENLEDIAKDCSHKADEEGITGYMYGASVSILSNVWEHGEELRKWYNIDTQIGTEGEKANKKGTTLNPALLRISK